MTLQEYKTASGETILYNGTPDFEMLERQAKGYGDIWHSSFEQGYRDAFLDLVHQCSVFFIYLNDFKDLDQCVSWRINPNHFAIRKTTWDSLGGFDLDYENIQMQALAFGYNVLRTQGAVPLYIKGLFADDKQDEVSISARDRYVFFRKTFKLDHSLFMIYRKGFWKFSEWKAFLYAKKHFRKEGPKPLLAPRVLKELKGNPTVSYIIPTMFRQDYTLRLLDDLSKQSYKPTQVVIVDATPENARDESLYNPENYPFEVNVIWQTSKGSCRARNEAIEVCKGEYIVFGDDDIRVPSEFIESHIRFLQTYEAGGCNGLDIRADNETQDLSDLRDKLNTLGEKRWHSGSIQMFSNANSCVKREYVNQLEGNDINFDGGYGEDGDFGISLLKLGVPVLHNPFSTNLHLEPAMGGYRFWGTQAKIIGKKRKAQPWELDSPVKWVRPVPSPTLMYLYYKQARPREIKEYRHKYFFLFLFKGAKVSFLYRILRLPYKQLQFSKSIFYAKKLIALGVRTK